MMRVKKHRASVQVFCLLVVDGVQALEDHDLVGLDELRWVLAAALQTFR